MAGAKARLLWLVTETKHRLEDATSSVDVVGLGPLLDQTAEAVQALGLRGRPLNIEWRDRSQPNFESILSEQERERADGYVIFETCDPEPLAGRASGMLCLYYRDDADQRCWVDFQFDIVRAQAIRCLERWERWLRVLIIEPDEEPKRSSGKSPKTEDTRADMKTPVKKAGASFERVQKDRPDLSPTLDKKARYNEGQYSHIRDHYLDIYPIDKHKHSTMPAFDSWGRYIREYLRLMEGPVNSPRAGRRGRSIVKCEELDQPDADE